MHSNVPYAEFRSFCWDKRCSVRRPYNYFDISINFEILSKSVVLWFKMHPTDHNDMILLPRRVQNFFVFVLICYEQEHYKVSLNFELDQNVVNGTGARHCLEQSSRYLAMMRQSSPQFARHDLCLQHSFMFIILQCFHSSHVGMWWITDKRYAIADNYWLMWFEQRGQSWNLSDIKNTFHSYAFENVARIRHYTWLVQTLNMKYLNVIRQFPQMLCVIRDIYWQIYHNSSQKLWPYYSIHVCIARCDIIG